jgi:hypothetical protein
MNLLIELEEFVDLCFDDLTEQLDSQISKNGGKATVDMGNLLQFLAMDVVGELAFGRSFGLTKAGYDTEDYLPMIDAYTASSCLSGIPTFLLLLRSPELTLLSYRHTTLGPSLPPLVAHPSSRVLRQRSSRSKSWSSRRSSSRRTRRSSQDGRLG